MKVYYLCACIPVPCIRGTRGRGGLCLFGTVRGSRLWAWLVAVMLCQCVCVPAQTVSRDSLSAVDATTAFRPRQLILPSALVAVGTFGVCNGWFHGVNHDVRADMNRMRGGCYWHWDDYLQYLPVTASVAMGSLGVKSRHPLRERVAVTAVAYASMGIIVNAGKLAFRERRPDSDARNSFPSGHTATAFMGAELVRMEYGGVYGWGAYTVATGIAALRLYNERHWLNDVIAGAGIGILSARIGYWLLPLNRRLLGWSAESRRSVVFTPVADPLTGGWGMAMSIVM